MILSGMLLRNAGHGAAIKGLRPSWSKGIRAAALAVIFLRSGLEIDLQVIPLLSALTLVPFLPSFFASSLLLLCFELYCSPAVLFLPIEKSPPSSAFGEVRHTVLVCVVITNYATCMYYSSPSALAQQCPLPTRAIHARDVQVSGRRFSRKWAGPRCGCCSCPGFARPSSMEVWRYCSSSSQPPLLSRSGSYLRPLDLLLSSRPCSRCSSGAAASNEVRRGSNPRSPMASLPLYSFFPLSVVSIHAVTLCGFPSS